MDKVSVWKEQEVEMTATEALVLIGAPPGTDANVVMKFTAPLRPLVQ